MSERAQKRRVFQVAKELKVVTPAVIEYLMSLGYEVNRQQMEPVTEEMYVELLRKFDRTQYLKYHNELTASKAPDKRADSARLRKEELEKIIAAKEPSELETKAKIELPKYHQVVIEAAIPKASDIDAEIEDVAKTKPDKVKGRKPRKRARKAKPVYVKPTETIVTEETKKGEEVIAEERPGIAEVKALETQAVVEKEEPPVTAEKREEITKRGIKAAKDERPEIIETPSRKARTKPELEKQKVVAPAVKELDKALLKQPVKKKFKRRRIVQTLETKEDALESAVTSKLQKETEKLTRQKTQAKKPGVVSVGQIPKRKRRRRKTRTTEAPKEVTKVRSKRRRKVDEKEVAATIKQTFAQITSTGKKHRHQVKGVDKGDEVAEAAVVLVTEFLTAQELANQMEVSIKDIITSGLEMGMIISINQRLDKDTIELLAAEFDIRVEFVTDEVVDIEEEYIIEDNLPKRPPVVTVMGHVDHGKTTLLDYLRRTKVAESEAGGITQHIGAYEIKYNEGTITFLDTPGHEAFTAMRARGAQVTDIVVLVVAADDRVMPQTLEAIDHAKVAGVPIIIALNKIDKPSANAEIIYKQLADNNILVEEWGGRYQSTEISAKFGQGIDDLLEEINVAADILDLKADPTSRARGIVIESRLDKGLGAVATVLIQSGTLLIGEPFVIGQHYGRVRAMYNEFGGDVREAKPSSPVQVVGFDGVPQAGDRLTVFSTEKEAREVSQRRQRQYREMSLRHISALTLDQVNQHMTELELKELPLLIKGDVHGSVEVLSDALMKLSTSEVQVQIIHRGVGGISESDVLLAAASRAIIIGFHVHPNPQARETARREGVEIRLYRVIHEIVDDVRKSLEGMLTPTREEVLTGMVEIRKVYKISRIGSVAGCYVVDGKINRYNRIRLVRDDIELWSGELGSLKRVKDDVKEVVSGFECGLTLNGYNDIREGDRVVAYELVETLRKLEDTA